MTKEQIKAEVTKTTIDKAIKAMLDLNTAKREAYEAGKSLKGKKFKELKGMYITKPSGKEIFLPWAYVTGRISRLIETNEYLTVEEHARFVEWKAEQDGLIVNVAKPNKPEPEEPKRLNLKNDKARREWLDNFRSWGVWLEVPQVDKTFYRFEFANGAVLIIEVGFEYWEFSTNKQPQERVSYSVIDDEHPKFNSQGESYTSVLQWLTKHGKEV